MVTTIRLPGELQAEAKRYAAAVGNSLNGLVGMALRDYLDRHPLPVAAAPAGPPGALGGKGRSASVGDLGALNRGQRRALKAKAAKGPR